VCVLLGSVVTE